MLKSLDLEYHNLDPDRGLYFGLEQEGRAPRLTTDTMVALAQDGPPKNTRAFGRGELVRHLLSCPGPTEEQTWKVSPPYIINWSVIHLKGGDPFPMADPFKTYAPELRQHIAHCLERSV